jgi:hypothetical protein
LVRIHSLIKSAIKPCLGKPTNSLPELSIILVDYHHGQSNILQEPLLPVSTGPHEFKFLSRNGHCLSLSRLFRSS